MVWDVPDDLTGADQIVVVQAVGATGQTGAGSTEWGGVGGAGGRAQTTLEASTLSGAEIWLLVAVKNLVPSNPLGASGGAPSLVSLTNPQNEYDPDDYVVIGGGGGGGGWLVDAGQASGAEGGAGGVAVSTGAIARSRGEDGKWNSGGSGPNGGGAFFSSGSWQGGSAGDPVSFLNGGSNRLSLYGGQASSNEPLNGITGGTLPSNFNLFAWEQGGGFSGLGVSVVGCGGGGGGGSGAASGGGGSSWCDINNPALNVGGGGGGGSQAQGSGGLAVPEFAQKWIPTADDASPSVLLTFLTQQSGVGVGGQRRHRRIYR
jgi:hypothetical protein